MASFGKTLMDSYYEKSREALGNEDYAAAQIYSTAEDLTNAFHSGLHPNEWLPKLTEALRFNAEHYDEPEAEGLWDYCASHAETLWLEVSQKQN